MTITELRNTVQELFDYGVQQIRENGQLSLTFWLIRHDGIREVVFLEGDAINDENAKRELGLALRTRVAAGDIQAVIMVSDIYYTEDLTPEAETVRRMFHMTIEQAANAGLCTKAEAVAASLESSIINLTLRQGYRRTSAGIELVGTVVSTCDVDGTGRTLPARFSGLFQTR